MRRAIAFVLPLLFQLAGAEAQQKGSRAGDLAGPKDEFRDCTACPELVVVPTFRLGQSE
jgi:hypothetical protein